MTGIKFELKDGESAYLACSLCEATCTVFQSRGIREKMQDNLSVQEVCQLRYWARTSERPPYETKSM